MKWKTVSRLTGLEVALILLLAIAQYGSGHAGTDYTLYLPRLETPIDHVDIEFVAGGLHIITAIASPPDDPRLFVSEKPGRIWIIDANGNKLATPFLDISSKVLSLGAEQGLLSLVFSPDYASDGYFYVNYLDLDGHTHLARYERSISNPNLADPNSESTVLTQVQPGPLHNGADLQFGPQDGYLYFSLGDGGNSDDAQSDESWLGKINRIDVSVEPYIIPPDNPNVGHPGTDAIWHKGFRNPWRFSFDRLTGDMYIGDVGDVSEEEISFAPAGSKDLNFGWVCYEGFTPIHPDRCSPGTVLQWPIHAWHRGGSVQACTIIGGYVYRGHEVAEFFGHYFFTDYCNRRLWSLMRVDGDWTLKEHVDTGIVWTTFGEAADGELYLGSQSGDVYRIVPGG
jgi:glucose/arabinose dehydrogenase